MVLDLVKEVFGEDGDRVLVKEGISIARTVKHECRGGKHWTVGRSCAYASTSSSLRAHLMVFRYL